MRLCNFIMITGTKETSELSTTTPTANLITSGVNGSGAVSRLDKKGGGFFGAFTTAIGDDDDDNPYGNSNLYHVSTVDSQAELAVTQSFSAPMTGSATTDFILVLQKNERGI